MQEAGRQLQEACDSLLQECNHESPRSNLIMKDHLMKGHMIVKDHTLKSYLMKDHLV